MNLRCEGQIEDRLTGKQTATIEEANRLKYPLHLTGTALQLCQLAESRGFGKEPDLAVSRIWDGAEGAVFPRTE
jgi:3-hydroxyisobutyrate dehydrogenase